MKKILFSVFALLISVVIGCSSPEKYIEESKTPIENLTKDTEETGFPKKMYVNQLTFLRSEPRTDGEFLDLLDGGTAITVLRISEENEEYYEVEYGGEKKYVSREYLTFFSPTPSPTHTPTPAPTINDVEIYFDKNRIEITSKEQVEKVNLCVDYNGYYGDTDYEDSLNGTGDANLEVGEAEVKEGKIKIPLSFSGLENGTFYMTYKIKGTNKKTTLEVVINMPEPENIIHEDEYVKICFSKIGKNGVEFLVENKTEYVLTIQADAIAINGYSTNDILMSDDIAPKSKGKAVAKCDDFEQGMTVEKISGQLRVIDFSNELLERSYDVKFIDFKIE